MAALTKMKQAEADLLLIDFAREVALLLKHR